MKQRYIFDLDGTLLDGNFSKKVEYFKSVLKPSDSKILIPKIQTLLEKYESMFERYDIDLLSRFISMESSVKVTPNIIKGWIEYGIESTIIDGVVDTLEKLKMNDKQLVVLTNWFSNAQIERLKESHLDIYFDYVYGGELYLKPDKRSYMNACSYTPIEYCIMVGDNYEKDVLGAREIGLDAIYFNRKKVDIYDKNSIKSFKKIKELY